MDRDLVLTSSHAKFNRADKLAGILVNDIDCWESSDPFSFTRETSADGTVDEFSWSVNPKPDRGRWSGELGDAIHNFRCALDHVLYAVATLLHGSAPPPDAEVLQFPICDSPKSWDRFRKDRLKTLPAPVTKALLELQPYRNRHTSGLMTPLHWLARLDDIDKHRRLHFTPNLFRKESFTDWDIKGIDVALLKFEIVEGPIYHGYPFLRVTKPAHANFEFEFIVRPTKTAVIDEGVGMESDLAELLLAIREEVEKALITMESLIP